jgi:hypothetical protein
VVPRCVEAYTIGEVRYGLTPVDRDLVTGVEHLSDVDRHVGHRILGIEVDTRSERHYLIVEHVAGLTVVVVVREGQLVVEEAEVDTEVALMHFLPLDVGIGHLEYAPARNLVVAAEVVEDLVADERAGVEELGDTVVTEDTVAAAHFQVSEPGKVLFDEFLFRSAPHHVDGGEVTPAVLLAEAVGAVAAEVGGQEVAAVVVEVDAAEE